jgi:FkbM family methyltransferase
MGYIGESRKLSYKKRLIKLLDRPGGRYLLGKIATSGVRRASGEDFEIRYLNGLWTRKVGDFFLPDSARFDYTYADFGEWKTQAERYAADTKDYWLQHYRAKDGDVIVDVGAGRGEDTLTFSRLVGRSGRVIAIEAHPLSYAILKSFCQLNRLANVILLHLALVDKPGRVHMTEYESSWTENAVNASTNAPGTEVRAATLADVCQELSLGDISFLKMNIEGAEREALLGMASVLPRVRQICVACHDFRSAMGHGQHFRTRAFVEQFLSERGFALTSRANDPRDYVRDHVFAFGRGCELQNSAKASR